MKEEWRDVDVAKGYYQVSNLGRMKRLPRTVVRSDGQIRNFKERIWPGAKSKRRNTSYYELTLYVNGEVVYSGWTHRLVAIAFLGGSLSDGYVVDHIDHNGLNNRVDNLRLITRRHNSIHRRPGCDYCDLPGVQKSTVKDKFSSSIFYKGRPHYLGNYVSEEDAYFAYLWASAMVKWGVPSRLYDVANKTKTRDGNRAKDFVYRENL